MLYIIIVQLLKYQACNPEITRSIHQELFGLLFIFTELNCWNFFKEIFQILHIYIQFDFYASCASSASFPDQIILDWFEWIFCTVVISHSVLYCLKPSTCISIVLSVLYPLLINFPCTFSFSCFLISEIYVMVMVRFLNIVVMCSVCSNNSEKFKWSQSTSSIYVDSNLIIFVKWGEQSFSWHVIILWTCIW